MIYCINPNCEAPENIDNQLFCEACNSDLGLNRKYKVLKQLGGGGFGTIWEVRDRSGTAKVLKVLRLNDPEAIALFEQEARVLQQLDHPGIPKVDPDDGYFSFQPNGSQEPLHCLVMEKIPGQNLQKWLEDRKRPLDGELAIKWLQQLVEILHKVHQQQFFHRDIKPTNIMLRSDGQLALIDFGTVKEITRWHRELTSGRPQGTVIYSRGYTPAEQENGCTVEQSDFFALGRSFVHLLTGKHPPDFYDANTGELRWREAAPDISPQLADFIDHLMARLPGDRPANTQEILDKLASLKQTNAPLPAPTTPKQKNGKKIIWLGLAAVVGLAAAVLVMFPREKSCPLRMGDHLSCGEESLLSGESIPEKQQGIAAFAKKNYPQAISLLESARKKRPRDPEILIYLNNARIAAQEADNYTIAVAVTLNSELEDVNNSGEEILRGVAQAQQEVNQGPKINGKMLRVAIADDGGEVNQSKDLGKSLGAQDDILAVVGHHSSKLTNGVVDVYQQNKLVLISPSSTLVKLSEAGEVFFRTVSNNRVIALVLTEYMKRQVVYQEKAAVFYNSQSPYSRDLKEQFLATVGREENILIFDLSESDFDAESAVAAAETLGAKMLVLFPDVKTREKGREVVKANQGRYCMMAGATLYNYETLIEVGKEAENRLVVANHWYRENSPNSEFPKEAKELWKGEVSWRTALAYDATRAAIAALVNKSQANRRSVQQALADPKFQTSGATGKISFQANGDRNEQIQELTTVVAADGGYKFVLIDQTPPLECD